MVYAIDGSTLHHTPKDARFVCSPAKVTFHLKVKLEGTQFLPHKKQQFEALCKEFQYIFSQHQSDIGHYQLIIMDTEMRHLPPTAQKTLYFVSQTYSIGSKIRNVRKI